MPNLISTAARAFSEFGPILVFAVAFHFWGLKPAIALSMAFCLAETTLKLRRGEKLGALFIYSSVMTFAFGVIDLISQTSFLFRYEAVMTNLMTAFFFGASLRAGKSVIQDFHEKKKDASPVTPELALYFRGLTCVWVAYFVAKAGAYAWISSRMGYEEALVIRTLLGTTSLYAMLGVSILGSRRIFGALKERGWLSAPAADGGIVQTS